MSGVCLVCQCKRKFKAQYVSWTSKKLYGILAYVINIVDFCVFYTFSDFGITHAHPVCEMFNANIKSFDFAVNNFFMILLKTIS